MKIRMHRNAAASYGCKLSEGETGTVDDPLGRHLVAEGIAECLDPPPAAAAIRAVPTPGTIAAPAPPAIKADDSPPTHKPRRRSQPVHHAPDD